MQEKGLNVKNNSLYVKGLCLPCMILPSVVSLQVFEPLRLYGFSIPAACLVSFLTSGELAFTDTAGVVTLERTRILVTAACSGFTFYMILCASVMWILRKADWKIFFFGYFASLAVNSVRILCVSVWETRCASRLPLPIEFQHMTVGITVFLSALMLCVCAVSYYRKGDCDGKYV